MTIALVDGLEITCGVCSITQPLENFSKDPKGKFGKTTTCKACAAQRSRESYKTRRQNPEWLKQHRRKYREANQIRKQWAVEYMGGKCNDCGGVFHQSVYDFHHINPSEKEGNPSSFLTKSEERLKEELAKCVLLCANCHRIRHFEGG